MISSVAPHFKIPAHMCTLEGCFGLPFSFVCSHFQWSLACYGFSSTTEHFSVNITSSSCSFTCRHISLNSQSFKSVWLSNQLTTFCAHLQPSELSSEMSVFFWGELAAKACMDSSGQLQQCQFIISLHFGSDKIHKVDPNTERWSSRCIFEWLSFIKSFQKSHNAPMAYHHFIFSENSYNFSRTFTFFLKLKNFTPLSMC